MSLRSLLRHLFASPRAPPAPGLRQHPVNRADLPPPTPTPPLRPPRLPPVLPFDAYDIELARLREKCSWEVIIHHLTAENRRLKRELADLDQKIIHERSLLPKGER